MVDQKFDYSATTLESSLEPRGTLQLEQKIEDSAKARSCSISKRFDEDVKGISGGECHGQNYKRGVHVMLMYIRVFWFVHALYNM